MKGIWLLSLLIIGVMCDDDDDEMQHPLIVGPLFSLYPCSDTQNIVVVFEAGHEQKHNNKYYLYVKRKMAAQSSLRLEFDSKVNITMTLHTDQYVRATLADGYAFRVYSFTQQNDFGLIVEGSEPGVTPYLESCMVDHVEMCNHPRTGYLAEYAVKTVAKKLDECGRRTVDHSELIVNGAPSKPGDWPWHAALYRMDRGNLKYICGGTLISKLHVLTAAHCVTLRGDKYPPEVFSVVLGKYKLIGEDKESEQKQVLRTIVHEQFNYRFLYNDIAILKLQTEVVYNDFIRPACLLRPEHRSRLSDDLMLGTIVGWGFDHTDSLSRVLQQTNMPMVSELTCVRASRLYYNEMLNNHNFCAGYHNGSSACNGDSGSAFQVFIPDDLPNEVTGTWHVKGIVSNTLARTDAPICDPNEYVLFTDVEKFVDWIDKCMEQ